MLQYCGFQEEEEEGGQRIVSFFLHAHFYMILFDCLTRDTQILDWSHDYWWLKRKSLYHSDGFHAALLQRFNELEVLRD